MNKFLFAFVVCAVAMAIDGQTADDDWKQFKVNMHTISPLILEAVFKLKIIKRIF